MGTLFAIEGVDGAGKQTQTDILYKRLQSEGKKVTKVSFPDYESEASYAVRKYLSGAFGKSADDVNAKAASSFFALDRYVSYKLKWEKLYKEGEIIIADRYVTSNMIHQASKIDDKAEKDEFLEWLDEFEYKIYGLPIPNKVIFLDVEPEVAKVITDGRKNKATGGDVQDIHEADREYIRKSYDNAKYVAEKFGWHTVKCAPDGKMRSIEDIADEIYGVLFG